MQRTTSCPSNGHIYPSPMQMVYGASPQEGQSWHMTPARTPEAERHHRGQPLCYRPVCSSPGGVSLPLLENCRLWCLVNIAVSFQTGLTSTLGAHLSHNLPPQKLADASSSLLLVIRKGKKPPQGSPASSDEG